MTFGQGLPSRSPPSSPSFGPVSAGMLANALGPPSFPAGSMDATTSRPVSSPTGASPKRAVSQSQSPTKEAPLWLRRFLFFLADLREPAQRRHVQLVSSCVLPSHGLNHGLAPLSVPVDGYLDVLVDPRSTPINNAANILFPSRRQHHMSTSAHTWRDHSMYIHLPDLQVF